MGCRTHTGQEPLLQRTGQSRQYLCVDGGGGRDLPELIVKRVYRTLDSASPTVVPWTHFPFPPFLLPAVLRGRGVPGQVRVLVHKSARRYKVSGRGEWGKLWAAESKLRVFIFKTVSKALRCECPMCVYPEFQWKGPVSPVRCPSGRERRLVTLEGQVTLLRNAVLGACFQLRRPPESHSGLLALISTLGGGTEP